MAKATPLRVNLAVEDEGTVAVIELFEFIDPFWGFGAVELSEKLKELTTVSRIKLRIHSRGGNAMEGFAIYSLLLSHPATVEAEIIGVAASAASVVAMAADTIRISEVGFLMIHDPWAFADGNSVVLRRVAEMLDRVQPAIVRAYARHSNLSNDEIATAMSEGEGAGTWYDAEQAIAAGLAHEVMTGEAVPENRIAFDDLQGVPQAALDHFAAEPSTDDGGGDLFAAVLDELKNAPRPDQRGQEAQSGERLVALLEEHLLEEPS